MQDTNTTPLKAFLLRNKISIYAFSKRTGIAPVTLSDLANGRRNACKRTAIRICEASKGDLTLEDFGYTKCDIIVKQGGAKSAVGKFISEARGKQTTDDGSNTNKIVD